jgi:hypothetical protein
VGDQGFTRLASRPSVPIALNGDFDRIMALNPKQVVGSALSQRFFRQIYGKPDGPKWQPMGRHWLDRRQSCRDAGCDFNIMFSIRPDLFFRLCLEMYFAISSVFRLLSARACNYAASNRSVPESWLWSEVNLRKKVYGELSRAGS